MKVVTGRRDALLNFGLGVAAGAVGLAASSGLAHAASSAPLTAPGAGELHALMERLAKSPRRRDFKTVPMILTEPKQWDHAALTEVLTYTPKTKQAWDMTEIKGPWLNLMSMIRARRGGFIACFAVLPKCSSPARRRPSL